MIPPSPTVAKAHLLIEGGTTLTCWFNPTTLHIARSADWTSDPLLGQGAPPLAYLGGKAEVLTVNVLLHAEGKNTDVRGTINALLALLDPTVTDKNRDQMRPRTLHFVWGRFVSALAICESVDVTVELFEADGTPLRAIVVLTLRQYAPEIGQGAPSTTNPTSRATLTRRSHTVGPGDSLLSIAYEHLGDAQRWKEIADANRIDDPTRLTPGQRLVVHAGAA